MVLAALLVLMLSGQALAPDTTVNDPGSKTIKQVSDSVPGSQTLVYTFAIMDNIAAPTWRTTQKAMDEAFPSQ